MIEYSLANAPLQKELSAGKFEQFPISNFYDSFIFFK